MRSCKQPSPFINWAGLGWARMSVCVCARAHAWRICRVRRVYPEQFVREMPRMTIEFPYMHAVMRGEHDTTPFHRVRARREDRIDGV